MSGMKLLTEQDGTVWEEISMVAVSPKTKSDPQGKKVSYVYTMRERGTDKKKIVVRSSRL